jgi:hypothetical protein
MKKLIIAVLLTFMIIGSMSALVNTGRAVNVLSPRLYNTAPFSRVVSSIRGFLPYFTTSHIIRV